VSVDGKKLGEYSTEEEAEKAIKADMKKQNYFTNVWFQDDHGGFVIRKGPWHESKSIKEAKEYTWLANKLNKKYQTLISEVSKAIGFDVNQAQYFCVELLENVNAHPEAKAVNNALLSFEESKSMKEEKKNNQVKKYDKSLVLRFINSRHAGDVKAAKESLKELKKALGDDFEKELLKHGDPDEPGKFDQVLAAWEKEAFSESKNLGEAEDTQSYEALVDLSNGKRLHLTHARGFSGSKESLIQKAKAEAEKKGWEAEGTIKFYKRIDGSEAGSQKL
jgi:hypothetical protein